MILPHHEESIKGLETGDLTLRAEEYEALLSYYPRLNENWLRFGEGEMLLPPKEKPA
jgi:hypothetical protein